MVMNEKRFDEERRRVVKYLESLGYIKSEKVKKALLRVPREDFIPEPYRDLAYVDRPLPIGYGQTISAIHMVAIMTEALDPRPGDKVLEIGTGSGYQAAVLAEIVCRDGDGHVYSIERIPELAEYARRNLERTGYSDCVTVITGDGTRGYPKEAPYDRIIVTAAAPDIPEPLIEQLKDGGRMVIPVGDRWIQRLHIVDKKKGKTVIRRSIECLFVPLIGEYGWKY